MTQLSQPGEGELPLRVNAPPADDFRARMLAPEDEDTATDHTVPLNPIELPRSHIPPDLAQLMDGFFVLQAQIDAIVSHTESSAKNWYMVQQQVRAFGDLLREFGMKTLANEGEIAATNKRLELLAEATWGGMRPPGWRDA